MCHLKLVAPAGALYAFPGITGAAAEGFDDHAFALELLETQDVLIVPGSSFNVPYRNPFRVTLLPEPDALREVFARIDRVLSRRVEAGRDDDRHGARGWRRRKTRRAQPQTAAGMPGDQSHR